MIRFFQKYHNPIFFGFLSLMVISLPLSRFGLSVAQFGLLGIWLFEGKFIQKWKKLISDKALLILISFYLLHVIGLLYTTDYGYAWKDLRIKLPLLFLPIVFATSPIISSRRFKLIIDLFILAVFISTLVSFWILLTRTVGNFRDLSPFISHIRLSLNVCLALFFTAYLFAKNLHNRLTGIAIFLLMIWFFSFLFMIESATGIIIVLLTGMVLSIGFAIKSRQILKRLSFLLVMILIPLSLFFFLKSTWDGYFHVDQQDVNSPELYTSEGNPYLHDTINQPVENGRYTWMYVCETELREVWNSRSKLPYDSLDLKGQDLKFTLIRYMNSKGLRKDKAGLMAMSDKDIVNVEMGIANVIYSKKISVKSRLYRLFWEYQISKMNGNPGGHTILQRIEFWKAASQIIKNNFIFGVGTGDIDAAFKEQYQSMNTSLAPQWQHRAHNQYLAVFVTFGLVGFIWFMAYLVLPAIILKRFTNYIYVVTWITLVISMLVEDTLESQVGVTLFAFMNAFLLYTLPDE